MQETKYLNNYDMAEGKSTLYHIYKKPSARKVNIAIKLYDRTKALNGYDERFIHVNGWHFHYAFKRIVDDQRYLIYITPTKELYIQLNIF